MAGQRRQLLTALKEHEGVAMRSRNRLWAPWWFWLIIVAIATILTWAIGAKRDPGWGQQFSANLFADALVAFAVSLLVVQWWERRARAEEESKQRRKVVTILRDELYNVQGLAKGLANADSDVIPVPIVPIPIGGWRSISSGPLLDSVPPEFLQDLLIIYSRVENINVVAERLRELTFGVSQSLSTAKEHRAFLAQQLREISKIVLEKVDSAIPKLDEYISETEERST